jgi:hypothetical protein
MEEGLLRSPGGRALLAIASDAIVAGAARRRAIVAARLASGRRRWNDWARALADWAQDWRGDPLLATPFRLATEVSFRDFTFGDPLALDGLIFPGGLDLSGALCRRGLALAGSRIDGDLAAREIRVIGGLDMDGVAIGGDLDLTDATLDDAMSARAARIGGGLRAAGLVCGGDAWLRALHVEGVVDLSEAAFLGEAGFGRSTFLSALRARGARFAAGASFDRCRFGGPVDFARARFEGRGWFSEAEFLEPAIFDGARFLRAPDFEGVAPGRESGARTMQRMLVDRIAAAHAG